MSLRARSRSRVIGLGDVNRGRPSGMARNDLGRFLERRSVVGQKIESESRNPDSPIY